MKKQLSVEYKEVMHRLNAPDMMIETEKLEDRKDKLLKDSYKWILANKDYQDFID